jgi:hypothetical protein
MTAASANNSEQIVVSDTGALTPAHQIQKSNGVVAVSAAHAQSGAVSARVPFDFVVGNETYSAGDYLLVPTGT